jgi:hypothetical protein
VLAGLVHPHPRGHRVAELQRHPPSTTATCAPSQGNAAGEGSAPSRWAAPASRRAASMSDRRAATQAQTAYVSIARTLSRSSPLSTRSREACACASAPRSPCSRASRASSAWASAAASRCPSPPGSAAAVSSGPPAGR